MQSSNMCQCSRDRLLGRLPHHLWHNDACLLLPLQVAVEPFPAIQTVEELVHYIRTSTPGQELKIDLKGKTVSGTTGLKVECGQIPHSHGVSGGFPRSDIHATVTNMMLDLGPDVELIIRENCNLNLSNVKIKGVAAPPLTVFASHLVAPALSTFICI